MKFFQSFKYRSSEPEIIDDLDYNEEALMPTLEAIEFVNSWLGGNQILVRGVSKILKQKGSLNAQNTIRLLDLGCGSGDGLRAIAEWAKKRGISMSLVGWDANPHIVEIAQNKSKKYSNIHFEEKNIASKNVDYSNFDLVTCNLFLHHFPNDFIIDLFDQLKDQKVKGIIVNDLHRHWLAYLAFQVFCWIFRFPPVARLDGLLSIKKGFKKKELDDLGTTIHPGKLTTRWRWAFRYQMIGKLD